MTLLRPVRDRGDLIQKIRPVRPWAPPPEPNSVFRGTQPPRKKAGHFALMARGPVFPRLRRWIPDNLGDRITGWLWPRFREVLAWLFCIAVGFLLVLAFVWRPWE